MGWPLIDTDADFYAWRNREAPPSADVRYTGSPRGVFEESYEPAVREDPSAILLHVKEPPFVQVRKGYDEEAVIAGLDVWHRRYHGQQNLRR